MRILRWILPIAAAAALAGCGGSGTAGSGPRNAEVAGIVTDLNGDVVRGARVWISQFGETDSNSSGAYVLSGIREGDWVVRASVTRDGITYEAENVARIFTGERTKNVNLTVVRESQQARVVGQVIDNQGFVVENARVFAIPTSLDIYTSSMELTNSNGRFTMDKLAGGVQYKITASGIGFNSDVEFVTVASGNEEEILLALKNPTNPLLPAPTGVVGVAWTSPSELTRSPRGASAIENVKRLFDPRVPKRSISRETINGNWIETDLFWDAYPDNDSHIGFGVYRRFGNSGSYTAIDFLRDPDAEQYEDSDADLQEFETWNYFLTALNTNYPETGNSESNDSNVATVETLGDLFAQSVLQGPLRFRWDAGSGADEYVIYLFDEYPSIGVSSIWNNNSNRATGTQFTYTGSSLQSGRRYYYVIIGLANNDDSRTISQVESFVAN